MYDRRGFIRLKILFISSNVLPVPPNAYGGIEALLYDFACWFSRKHDVTVAAVKGSKLPREIKLIETIDHLKYQDREDLAFKFYEKYLNDYDVIHDFSHQHIAARSFSNLPILNMIWDPILIKYDKANYNLITLSEWQKRRVHNVYNKDSRFLHLPINANKYKPRKGGKKDFFIFIARMTKGKGALEAAKLAIAKRVSLKIIGGSIASDPKDYENLVKRISKGSNFITFLGNVPEKKKILELRKAKALLYPLLQVEATSMVIPEALMCGVPVISLKHSSLPELVDNGQTGFLCNNLEEMQEAMDNIDLINRETCRKKALEKFSSENIFQKYEDLYLRVMKGERW